MDNAVGILEQVAPTIASMIGGPFAGMAVSGIEKVFGLQPTGDQQVAMQAVAGATPEQLAALKKIDNDFQVSMKQLDVDLAKAGYADNDSARKMQEETKDWTPRVIALMTFFGFFGVLAFVGFHGVSADPNAGQIVTLLMGTLGTVLTQIVAFYFGSSAGSAVKDSTIKKLASS